MPTFRLHNWEFARWEGPPPTVAREHIGTHARPGVDGVTHTQIGEWGEPFRARFVGYYASELLARDALRLIVYPLLREPPVRLWYAGVDYLTRYQTIYKLTDLAVAECRSVVRIVGNGLNLPNAGILSVDVTLVPHSFVPTRRT